jgi:hypothetical protein
MENTALQERLEEFRADYASVTGHPFQHFFCPILFKDEPGELCKGHIIPDVFGTCSSWVPQRKDIDNFYGSVAEKDFFGFIEDRPKTPVDIWHNRDSRGRHSPLLKYNEKSVDHYFPKEGQSIPPGHSPMRVVSDGKTLCDIVIKDSTEEARKLSGKEFRIVIEQDYRPSIIASVLKAAHLTMFHMLGYKHVFSPAGIYVASTLKQFFATHKGTTGKKRRQAFAAHFHQYGRMISRMVLIDRAVLGGTIVDSQILACIGGTEGVFALGVIIPVGNDACCVFLPPEGNTIGTYFNFLNEPPPSILVRHLRFRASTSDGGQPCFVTSPGEPVRIDLSPNLPGDS